MSPHANHQGPKDYRENRNDDATDLSQFAK
jgi:hypothetical protein